MLYAEDMAALIRFPRFVGGSNLGATLNPSMMRKSEIVGQFLNILFPGIVIYLVQGSPSGSSASGGTHLGQGDAGDFVYRYADGRSGSLAVYLMASLFWRMLNCVSYVRGFDVDKNGVKDDSFDQHNHVIDREGVPKVLGAQVQINQFVAHLDGLQGNRADRERMFPTPMNLAEYETPAGQATFLFRFKALTNEAIGLPNHVEPKQEETLSTYVRVPTSTEPWKVYVSDGMTARHVQDEMTLADLAQLASEGLNKIVEPAAGPGVDAIACHDASGKVVRTVNVRSVRSMSVVGTIVSPPVVAAPVTATVDVAALAKALVPLLPQGQTVDLTGIMQALADMPKAVRTVLIKD